MTFLLIGIFVLYALMVFCLHLGWQDAVHRKIQVDKPDNHFISVIIPVRNEGQHISFLLDDLIAQNFPNDQYEMIVVDDHSEDQTVQIVQEKIKGVPNATLILSIGQGKKAAIVTGIQYAKGRIVATTDADCRFDPNWLESISSSFENESVKMVVGSVKIQTGQNLFSKMQALEFSSLVGTGAATLSFGTPTMCNGANLAYRKEVFTEVGGYSGNETIASGDDEFLMRKISARYQNGIRFNHLNSSVVTTQPQSSLSAFVNQRLRWAGKWRHHLDTSTKLLATFIFAFHSSTLLLLLLFCFGQVTGVLVLIFFLLKGMVEFIFLRAVTSWLKIRWHWPSFFLLQILYAPYAIGIGLFSLFKTPEWKGRK